MSKGTVVRTSTAIDEPLARLVLFTDMTIKVEVLEGKARKMRSVRKMRSNKRMGRQGRSIRPRKLIGC